MNIKLRDVLIWAAIAFAYLLILGTPSQDKVDYLQSKVDSQTKIIKEHEEKINILGTVVQENVELINTIYKCNPYCQP